MDTLIKLASPLFALLGTVIVASFGFYQWRRQQPKAVARRAAREELWRRLEQINLSLRRAGTTKRTRHAQLRDVNTYFLSHSLYLDDADQRLVNDYVRALNALRDAVHGAGDEHVKQAWADTQVGMPPGEVDAVREAVVRADELRAKVKKMLGGTGKS